MRNTLVAALSASILAGLSLVAIPSAAQSQVIIVVGNGSGQPYYPPPFPPPLPYPPYLHTPVLYGGGVYPGYGYGYGYPASGYGYYYGGGYGYSNAYSEGGYYPPY